MNPFHSTAVWFVSKLPDGSSEVAVAAASYLGVVAVAACVLAIAITAAALLAEEGEQ